MKRPIVGTSQSNAITARKIWSGSFPTARRILAATAVARGGKTTVSASAAI